MEDLRHKRLASVTVGDEVLQGLEDRSIVRDQTAWSAAANPGSTEPARLTA
jgi:hypothetical protein